MRALLLPFLLLLAVLVTLRSSHACEVYPTVTLEKDTWIEGLPVKAGIHSVKYFGKVAKPVILKLSQPFRLNGLRFPADTTLTFTYSENLDPKSGAISYLRVLSSATFPEPIVAWDISLASGGSLAFWGSGDPSYPSTISGSLPPDQDEVILGYPLKRGTSFSLILTGPFESVPSDHRAWKQLLSGTLSQNFRVNGVDLPAGSSLSMGDGVQKTVVYHLSGNLEGLFWSAKLTGPWPVLGYPLAASQVFFYASSNQPEAFQLERPAEIQGIPVADKNPEPPQWQQNRTVYFHPNGDLEAAYLSRPFAFSVKGETVPAAKKTPVWLFEGLRPRQLTLAADATLQGIGCSKDSPVQFDGSGTLLFCKTAKGNYGDPVKLAWYEMYPP